MFYNVNGNLQFLQGLSKTISEFLFLEAGKIAFPPITSAAVVDVLFLLDLACHHATIMSAVHQAAKGDVALRVFGSIVPIQNRLYLSKELLRDEERMRAPVFFATPAKLTDVELVRQHLVNVVPAHVLAILILKHLLERRKSVSAGCVLFHQTHHHRRIIGIALDGPVGLVIAIPKRRVAWIDSLEALFAHAFLHFFFEVFGISTRNHQIESMHNAILRARVLGNDLPLFRKVNFEVQVLDCDVIVEIPIKAISLLHQQYAAGAVPLHPLRHLAECFPSPSFCGLHILECLHDLELMTCCIIPKESGLGSKRKALLLLLPAGYARIYDGWSHAASS